MRKLYIIFLIVLLLFPAGCNYNLKHNTYTSGNSSTSSYINKIYLTTDDNANYISVQVLTNKFNDLQIEFIKNAVHTKLFQICNNNFLLRIDNEKPIYKEIANAEYYIDISSNISYYSNDLVSIIFKGIYNKNDAAHPLNLFFVINFNPQTLEKIYFSDNFIINSELYDNFSKVAKEKIIEECGGVWPEQFGEFCEEILTKEEFINGLNLENSAQSTINCYYTKDSVGFSYETVYSLGGHKEVELPLNVLKRKTQ